MRKTLEEIKKYDTFVYDRFEVEYGEKIVLRFYYEIKGLENFVHRIELPCTNDNIDKEYIEKLAFNIGMVELVNYWKLTIAPNIIIKCGKLTKEQEDFFRKLYFNGEGEFFYVNGLKPDYDTFVNFNSLGKVLDKNVEVSFTGNMIGVGGGKDSCVSLELIINEKDNACFIINPKPVTLECCKVANIDKVYEVRRVLDKKMIDLNNEGYLNGHIPFSAMVAFVSYLLAYLNERKYVVLSNESSANESNVAGTNINHQYSKSYEFEDDFQKYAAKYLGEGIKYFSFLRPLSEYQIGMIFANRCQRFHKIFKSCNVGSKGEVWHWCCNCAKCLFVFSLLSPHLYKDKLVEIFGEDMFENKELLTMFKELLGKENVKPFDCVGTFEEINYAITKTIKRIGPERLPYLLKYYRDNYYDEKVLNLNLEEFFYSPNSLEEPYLKLVKDAIKYDK